MANIAIFIHFKKRNMSQEMCFFSDKLTFTMLMDFQKRNILETMDGGFPCQQPQKHPALFMIFSVNSSLYRWGDMLYA